MEFQETRNSYCCERKSTFTILNLKVSMGEVSLTNKVYDHLLTVFVAFFFQIIGGAYFQFFSVYST